MDIALNNFTPRAAQVVALAKKEAVRKKNGFIGPEYLLLGLIKLDEGAACQMLRKMGVNLEAAHALLEEMISSRPVGEAYLDNPIYTPRTKKVFALAGKEAMLLNQTYTGTEHILLALIKEGDSGACKVLKQLGVELENIREELRKFLDPSYKGVTAAHVAEILQQEISFEGQAGKVQVKLGDLKCISMQLASGHSINVEPKVVACLVALSRGKGIVSSSALLTLLDSLEAPEETK
ncbi:MAG: hypothetical protein A3C06_03610 [Candidatus Taylorbacteria bacterium RIFCSPHIGHO2_02_FULL_46_13]|uniref:Clp R domain-containing protein n=1 Tax=Candidatus Taylorbacteria bacterium RIFCSPHIGHO2_02_FULL_46_13 TaxID=1802312 RepID=A0A1G2MR20_9BACT|nr:MAG: hypothetical protein A3C06_03610 [Candidatus Taylorbacteria bacterium RIFCSPHIGHO2_02_FULL_46_13]